MDILAGFSPEQLTALKAALLASESGRSPFKPRQLHDLRLLPTKDDPRPMFILSTESPRDGGDLSKTSPFPALRWHKGTGDEVRVESAQELAMLGSDYVAYPPADRVVTPVMELSELVAGLPEYERAALLKAADQTRMETLRDRLALLSPDDLAALIAGLPKPVTVPGQKRA